MPIRTTVPESKLRPGNFIEVDVTSAQRGLAPSTKRLALIGGKLAAGSQAAATPVPCFSEKDFDAYFGAGSELALMGRAALAAARKAGQTPPQLWGVGVADAGGAVKATYTLTVTGPATASGTLIISLAGRLVLVNVASGDAQNTIATAIKTAFDGLAAKGISPVVASVATNVVTLTAANAGPVGNDIRTPTIVQTVAGVTVVAAAGTAGSGAYDIQASLDALSDKRYALIALGTHIAGDITKLNTHIAAVGLPQTKRFSGGVVAEYGSVATATALATGSNAKETTVVACRDWPALPGEVAAEIACTALCKFDNPARPLDNVELDLVPCAVTSVYTDPELETLLGAGCTPLTPNATQDGTKIVRWVSTMTTLNGAPFLAALDATVWMTIAEVGLRVDADWKLAFPPGTLNNSRTVKRVYSVTLDTLKKCEANEWIQNVDAHKAELLVEVDANNPSRDNVAIPVSVVPGLHQLDGVLTLFVEAAQ